MALCHITGTVQLPDGTNAAGRILVFKRNPETVVAQSGHGIVPDEVAVRVAADGSVDFKLYTANYIGFLRNQRAGKERVFGFPVPEASSALFQDILQAVDPVEPLPSWLTEAFEARDEAVLAEMAAQDAADRAEANAALVKPQFDSVAKLQADTAMTDATVPVGGTVSVNGLGSYVRVSSGGDTITAGGLQFSSMIGRSWDIRMFGAKGDGIDDTAAFIAVCSIARAGDAIFIPRPSVAWVCGDGATVPSRVSVVGEGYTRVYNPTTTESLDGLPIIRKKAGTGGLRFSGNQSVIGVILDGLDRTGQSLSSLTELHGMILDRVSVVRWGYGTTAYSLNNSRLIACSFSQNDVGVRGLIDSQMLGGEVNANRVGIAIPAGANDSVYLGVKNEWNTEEGWLISGGNTSNQVIGGITDRNGRAGARISGAAEIQFIGNKFRRNGKNVLGENDCTHFYIDPNVGQKILIEGCMTAIGGDDGGGGDITPNYSVRHAAGSGGIVSIIGGDLTGSVTSPIVLSSVPPSLRIVGVNGVNDQINVGFPKTQNGRAYLSAPTASSYTSGESKNVVLETGRPISTFSNAVIYSLTVSARNQSTGADYYAAFPVVVQRESGDATVAILSAQVLSASGAVGILGTDTVQISATVNSDASAITMAVKNNHASNSVNISLVLSGG